MLGLIAVALLVLALFGTPLVWLYQVIRDTLKFFFGDWWNRTLPFTTLDPLHVEILEKNCRYYQCLSRQNKKIFVKRLKKFISLKEFESRENLVITIEMEVLVAAVAIQLTFGHPSIYFRHFSKIILYPDAYYSTNTGLHHLGEVNMRG